MKQKPIKIHVDLWLKIINYNFSETHSAYVPGNYLLLIAIIQLIKAEEALQDNRIKQDNN